MDNNLFKFEYFPNEILLEIFKNLDAKYIFQAFYNLNSRFNALLLCLNHYLTIFTPNYNEFFFPYIHTLIVQNGMNIIPDQLINVRHLVLDYSSNNSLKNLDINIPLNLEHLSIISPNSSLMTLSSDFIQKIFSNDFPYLKSCCLPHKSVIFTSEKWAQSLSLRIFKIGYIRCNIYKAILSLCPNLCSLKFSKWPLEKTRFHIEPHMNIKRMIINLSLPNFLHYERMCDYLSSVPKLEKLTINLFLRDLQIIESIDDCDWFSLIIDYHLPRLRQFNCYLCFTPSTNINEFDHIYILNQMKEKFQQRHTKRYQSKILFKFLE